ncbi:MAG: response regulator [Alphaproteobacteria bacterium]|nr:response regulator [Alphaproteobacteria bacterium]
MVDYSLERLNLLVVDDNKHMRALVKSILHALGVRSVHEAIDGADAFKELRHFPADLIICDWNMEPLDGLDFVRLVRTGADSPNPYVSIIMLTGHTELNRVLEARDTGVHEFLAKPISAKKLYSRIKAIIEHERKFIKAGRYFGPDRRRRVDPSYSGGERRKAEDNPVPTNAVLPVAVPAATPAAEPEGGKDLNQDEIEALLNS